MKLLPDKPSPGRFLARFPFRIKTLQRMKEHTSIEESI
jgi:hypothetical protein